MDEERDAKAMYRKDLRGHDFPHHTNSELVRLQQQALDGDREAHEALWMHGVRMSEKIAGKLRNVGILDAADYQDAVQEGNLAIGGSMSTWSNNQGRYGTYMWTVIRNAILRFCNKEHREGLTGGDLAGDTFYHMSTETQHRDDWNNPINRLDMEGIGHVGPEDVVVNDVDLARAMAELTDREVQVIELHYFEDMSDPAIAEKLGITKQTVHERRMTAISKMRKFFS